MLAAVSRWIMINFTLIDGKPYRYFDDEAAVEAARESLERHDRKILADLSDIKQNKFYLGCHLLDLLKSEDYAADPGWIMPNRTLSGKIQGCSDSFVFMSYCEKHFGLDRSQVSRYMNIVDEFGDEMRGYKAPYDRFSYSQLVEMLPLSDEQRKKVLPSWTVKEIREYKKKLNQGDKPLSKVVDVFASGKVVATSQQDSTPLEKPVATSQQEQKPLDPTVATSQQQPDINSHRGILMFERAFENDIIQFPEAGLFLDLTKYDRCRGLTLKQLCDLYIRSSEQASIASKHLQELQIMYSKLEQKYDELCASLNITNAEAKK